MTEPGPREVLVPSPPGGPVPWLLGAGALGLVVLAVAASSGPVQVATSPPPGSARSVLLASPTVTTTTAEPLSNSSLAPNANQLPDLPPVIVLALKLLVFALVAWAVYLLLKAIWRHFPRWHTRVVASSPIEALPSLPEDLLETADARLGLLQEGSPRNAIVACWVDLEESATSAGLPRRPAETSAEFTVRVLRTWDVAPDAMGRLAELYREARHSRHQLTEQHRAEAVSRLEAIHDDLRRVVAESQLGSGESPVSTRMSPDERSVSPR